MSCFLLPNSLCGLFESIFAKIWWKKGLGREKFIGVSKDTCVDQKIEEGLGFRNMSQFNIALLAKQGWRLLVNPNSFVAQVLKAKYFPENDFLNSRLGNRSSYA
ncbi:hypothetical protein PVK06_009131 [Gossypium arboreum]|uniref:Uncharacterized protein n=1 Tax=Gossypium arboreum TaxID=29729 RepID=A0ABR0QMU5_GOSAR|nr:hypothetical protein PVK06_009131 [Gossypium arboreum]